MSGSTGVLPLEKFRTHKVPCGGLTPVLSELLQGHVTLFFVGRVRRRALGVKTLELVVVVLVY
jgi:hypothetical protein